MSAFRKLAMFTDIHFDEHGGSEEHNKNCLDFIDWFIDQSHDCDTLVFGGDWHHYRPKVNTPTLLPSYEGVKKLADTGKKIFWIIGNHDLPYLEKRDLHSLPFLKSFDNIIIVDEPVLHEDVLFVPWLTENDDLGSIARTPARYVFGHFEFPGFMMNQNYEMPDKDGILKSEQFENPEYVFCGHYHGRQFKQVKSGTWIHYIGNAFPHNFSDANDTDRGMMTLEYGSEPVYLNWPDMPKYTVVKASEIDDLKVGAKENVRLDDDIGLTDEERLQLQSMIVEDFGALTAKVKPLKKQSVIDEAIIQEGEDIMAMVIRRLKETEEPQLDNSKLVDIFLNAEVI